MPTRLLAWLQARFGPELDERLRRYVMGGALLSFALQVLSSLLVLLSNVLLARWGGDEAYGVFSYVFNAVFVLAILAGFGLEDTLMKRLPGADAAQGRQLIGWALLANALCSLLLGGLAAAATLWLPWPSWQANGPYLRLGLLALPLLSLTVTMQAALRAKRRLLWGQLADKLLKPLGIIAGLALWAGLGWPLDDRALILVNIGAFALAALVAAALLWRGFGPPRLGLAAPPRWWWREGAHFAFLSLLFVLTQRIDLFFVGAYLDMANVGYHNVAVKFAELLTLPRFIASTVLAPLYAELHGKGERAALQALIRRSNRVVGTLTLLGWLGLALLGNTLIGWYGPNFGAAYWPLLLIGLGHLSTAIIGPVGYVLMMTGHTRYSTLAHGLQLLLLIGLHLWLTPRFGLLGAAASTSACLLGYNLLVAYFLKRRLGLGVW